VTASIEVSPQAVTLDGSLRRRPEVSLPSLGATIVDTHVHFWDPQQLSLSLARRRAGLEPRRSCRVTTPRKHCCRMSRRWCSSSVAATAASSLEEARWVAGLAAGEPRLGGIVAQAAVEQGTGVRVELAALREIPRVVGIRRNLENESRSGILPGPSIHRRSA
jgi:L-fuconolactonase